MHKRQSIEYLLSLPMTQLSRSVVFVDTNPKSERIAVLKGKTCLANWNTDVFHKSLIDTNTDKESFITCA